MKEILECLVPKISFEVISYHGLDSFYNKFIRNFSGLCTTLTAHMRKEELKRSVVE